MMQGNLLIGRIIRLQIFKVPEFGTRASFSLERLGQGAVTCSVAGDVAREFVTYYREGNFVARPHLSVSGLGAFASALSVLWKRSGVAA